MHSSPISLKEFTVNEWGKESLKVPIMWQALVRVNSTINAQNQLLFTLIRILGINLKLYNHFGGIFEKNVFKILNKCSA